MMKLAIMMLSMINTFVPKIMSCHYGHVARAKRNMFIEQIQNCVMLVRSKVIAPAAKVDGTYFVLSIRNISTR